MPSPTRSFTRVTAVALLALAAVPATASAQTYSMRIADGNRVGMTTTNFGCFGNNFVSRAPSMEFPLGAGYEHLVYGGLWIGARARDADGAFTGVTTAVVDVAQGLSLANGTEYSPVTPITVRSSRPAHPFYHPDAVSELDHVMRFTDTVPKTTQYGVHRPLGIDVRQETYAWSGPGYADYQDVLFVRLVVTNRGEHALEDLWVGINTELQSGNKNAYSTWPPSGSSSPHGSWYGKAWLQYDADLRLLREHRCTGPPLPAGCQLEIAPYWAGLQLLTPPRDGPRVTLAAWEWQPAAPARDEDVERYALLSAGVIVDLDGAEFQPGASDPVELLASDLLDLPAGDSVIVDFAFVGGAEIEDIRNAARHAQHAYDRGYRDLVTAVEPRTGAAARLAIESARPLPGGAIEVEFTLPEGAGTRLEAFDVAGRRLARVPCDGLGAGMHRVRVAVGTSGVVYLRLAQGGAQVVTRCAVAR
jgi:hypothetical protein